MTNMAHELEWSDRLQDWLDGALAPDEQGSVESHLATCASCREHLDALRALDTELSEATPRLSLDASFDARVFAQIASADEARLAADRRRLQAELESDLARLAKQWRRTLAIIAPGVLAGIALAFGLAEYFDTAEWMRSLTAQSAGEIGIVNATHLHMLLTSAVGAAIGYLVARWLAREAVSG